MTKRHVSLYNKNENPAPVSVIKQELVTMEQTEQGVRITRFKRHFKPDEILESFESEPVLLSPERLFAATSQKSEDKS